MQLCAPGPEKFCPNNTRIKEWRQRRSFHGSPTFELAVSAKWTPEYVLFSHSGISGNPITGSRTLLESREHFYCSVIISPHVCLPHVELIRGSDIRSGVFRPAAERLCPRNRAREKRKTTFGVFNPIVQQQQTNRHRDNICMRFQWNSFFISVINEISVPTLRARVGRCFLKLGACPSVHPCIHFIPH